MRVYINKDGRYAHIVKYVIKIIEKNTSILFDIRNESGGEDLVWDHNIVISEPINIEFYNLLYNEQFDVLKAKFESNGFCFLDNVGKKDIVATIFYMSQCIQEYGALEGELDEIGRFKYTSSYQFKNGNITSNLVQKEINSWCQLKGLKRIPKASRFFLSHDIDSIYGSLKQDGFWALKNINIGAIFDILSSELLKKPKWRNISQILQLHNDNEIKSTFFWLVNKGMGIDNVENADYEILKESELINLARKNNSPIGLHKSSSAQSFDDEMKQGNLESTFNRNHFLKFSTQKDWPKISSSCLEFDASLGFAEHYGFRNSYGKAFQPFDIKSNAPFKFVEAPLHLMDGTFHKYMKVERTKIGDLIIRFYLDNAEDCDISLLWHNTYFTQYKYGGFLDEYKKVIAFINENKIECVTPDQLIKESTISW